MWVDREQLRFPWNQQGPLRPLSAFSYKLFVLVTVSRLWLGITYYTSLGISGVQQDPPPKKKWTPVGFGSKAEQTLGWPICHEIMPNDSL